MENVLTAEDRCDACGAQAYVRARFGAGELLFCAHHARKHGAKLESLGAIEVDETSRLRQSMTSVS
ncbi:MAG: hypothetical protein Q3999_06140 [Buchananella hordeovulneris]|nr:hypothetical protein [Buchananella hordeovulneris]